jgi:hypothetical protein
MSIVTAQQLARYYEQYRTTEVTFNRQVAGATGLIGRNIYLKVADRQLPCTVVSSSMAGARVVAAVTAGMHVALKQANDRANLRWCFKLPDKVEPISFFVPCHAAGFAPYAGAEPDMQLITLEFTQRPADDLILILGTLLEANVNERRRRDERITISPESMKKMGLESREAALIVDRTARRCVLRDVSFGGLKVLTAGPAELFGDRHIVLKIDRGGVGADIVLAGIVRHAEEVGGHKEIISLGVQLEGEIPMSYKLLISSYLSTVRKPGGPEAAPGDRQPPAAPHEDGTSAPAAARRTDPPPPSAADTTTGHG